MVTREISTRYKEKMFHNESGSALEQVAHRSCRISISGDFQNSEGQSPEQIDLTLKLVLFWKACWVRGQSSGDAFPPELFFGPIIL